jgi:ribonuclease G
VVDFIDMQKPVLKKMLFNKMSEVMKKDRAKHYILPPSKFGLVQITRQRVRPEMEIRTAETIPSPDGEALEVQATILLVDEIENKLEQLLSNGADVKFLEAHPFVAAYFRLHRRKFQWKWLLKHKKWIKIVPRNAFHLLKYEFLDKEGEKLKW